ncbi:MAG: hypothetical protein AAFU49_04765, partial [Pseudomonadota bacterium]
MLTLGTKPELAVGEHVLAGVDDTDPENGALLIPDTSVWFFGNGPTLETGDLDRSVALDQHWVGVPLG